jgi:hypothetical protein
MRVRRYLEVIAGLALVSVLTAASPAWGAGKTPNLKPQLLTISAMPPGWSVHSDTPPSSCVTAAINGAPGKVAAAFEDSGGAPTFTEVLLPGGANRYTSWKKSLDKCHQFKITNSSGTTVTATLAALSFPTLGQRSAAYALSFTLDGVTGAEDVVVALSGSTVVGLSYGDVESVDVNDFESLANKAMTKLSSATTATSSPAPTTTTTQPSVVVPPNSTLPTLPPTTTPPTAAPAAACSPATSSGNCYSAGEYCPDADHGASGTAGNGEAMVCEDNNGWRWEPA